MLGGKGSARVIGIYDQPWEDGRGEYYNTSDPKTMEQEDMGIELGEKRSKRTACVALHREIYRMEIRSRVFLRWDHVQQNARKVLIIPYLTRLLCIPNVPPSHNHSQTFIWERSAAWKVSRALNAWNYSGLSLRSIEIKKNQQITQAWLLQKLWAIPFKWIFY